MTVLKRAMDSSVIAQHLRRLTADSVVCAAAAAATARWRAVTRWLHVTRQRIVEGLGGEWSDQEEIRTVERLGTLLSTSRIATMVASVVRAPMAASRDARVWRLLGPLRSPDLATRVRTGSCAIVAAVLCHTVLLAVVGVPVYGLGWTTRAGLLAIGAAGLRWPHAVVAAWRDRQNRAK
jgi:hypothetical protein